MSRDGDQSQNIGATGEVPVQEHEEPRVSDQFQASGSPVGSDGGSSRAGTFGHMPDNESPNWIYPVPPVTPEHQPLRHVQFQDSSFAMCPAMDTSNLDLTPFGITPPFTAFSSDAASPNFTSLCTVYQQVRNFSPSTATAALRVVDFIHRIEDPCLPISKALPHFQFFTASRGQVC